MLDECIRVGLIVINAIKELDRRIHGEQSFIRTPS